MVGLDEDEKDLAGEWGAYGGEDAPNDGFGAGDDDGADGFDN